MASKIKIFSIFIICISCSIFACSSQSNDFEASAPTEFIKRNLKDLMFFDDFESVNYSAKWVVHWGSPPGEAIVKYPSQYIFAGKNAIFTRAIKGQHESIGAGEYILKDTFHNEIYVRLYLCLEEKFSMGLSRQLKLFGIFAGKYIENVYGGACTRPNGYDKFSATLSLDNWNELHVYYYSADQQGICGDIQYCKKLFCKVKLKPGKWYCLELMLKPNVPGSNNGKISVWVNGNIAISINKMRLRDSKDVIIRRIAIMNYFGGDLVTDTSPKNQRIFIDDFAIDQNYIGLK